MPCESATVPAAVSPARRGHERMRQSEPLVKIGKAPHSGRVRRPAMTGKGFTPAGENRVAIRYGMP